MPARSILTENVVGDVDYRWTANPYRGCAFACAACYARGSHEYLDLDPADGFDTTIVAKHDAPELLRAAFDRPSWHGATITFSSVSDPYQPLEAELQLTRRCLEVCLAYRNPVRIVTRSPLVTRDLDVLQALHSSARCIVDMSVAFVDATRTAALEPGAPLPDARFAAMRELAEAGLSVGVMASPILSGLNDSDLVPILERAAESGVSRACWVLARLPEPTATVFATRLARAYPAAASKILRRATATKGPDEPVEKPFHTRGDGGGGYVAALEAIFAATCARLGLAPWRFEKQPEPPSTFRRPDRGQLALFGDSD